MLSRLQASLGPGQRIGLSDALIDPVVQRAIVFATRNTASFSGCCGLAVRDGDFVRIVNNASPLRTNGIFAEDLASMVQDSKDRGPLSTFAKCMIGGGADLTAQVVGAAGVVAGGALEGMSPRGPVVGETPPSIAAGEPVVETTSPAAEPGLSAQSKTPVAEEPALTAVGAKPTRQASLPSEPGDSVRNLGPPPKADEASSTAGPNAAKNAAGDAQSVSPAKSNDENFAANRFYEGSDKHGSSKAYTSGGKVVNPGRPPMDRSLLIILFA